ncbi:MAG: NAD(+)/NADH kinase [Gammaproteobacteria bacterium]|nr:NAD(+)/NADH kinase [Gammaproteobacteria bacterium]
MNAKQPVIKRIGLFAKVADPETGAVMARIVELLRAANCDILAAKNAASLLPGSTSRPAAEIAASVDLAIVVGGDGSLLAAARALKWAPVPLVGINRGRIGFLADVRSEALHEELEPILRGDYTLERRSMLRVQVGTDTTAQFALNDVVIKGSDGSRMIEIETRVDGARFSRTRGDGLIVSTPTGSTAYALSSGGPIIAPGLDAFAIVPVSPHSLGERPVVIPAGRVISLHPLIEDDARAEATLDGQISIELTPRDTVRVSRAEPELLLVHPPGYEYFATLREKLGWGGRAPEC